MPFVIVILLILLVLESTLLSLPLSLIFLICLLVLRKDRTVFILGFMCGVLLDILLVRNVGSTPFIIVTILFLIMLYQRKFEIASYYFIGIASGTAALLYVVIFHVSHPFFYATISAVLAILFFSILQRVFVLRSKIPLRGTKNEKPLSTV